MNAPDVDALLDLRILFSVPGMRDNRAGIRTRVVSTYRTEAAAAIAALHSAVAARDAHALRQAAHGLKSASGALGAMRVYRLARDIENAARDGRNGFDTDLEAGLAQAVQQTLATLDTLDAAGAPLTRHATRDEQEPRI